MLVHATPSPDFPNYLTFLFRTPEMPPSFGFDATAYQVIRFAASLNLKTKIRVSYRTMTPQSLEYIKASALHTLQDPTNGQIRNASGSLITEIIQQGGLEAWPDLLSTLLPSVTNVNGTTGQITQESALSALSKICEDHAKLLLKAPPGQQPPLNIILPNLMQCTASPLPNVRSMALSCITSFISRRPPALIEALEQFLYHLFQLASDPDTDVRKNVCKSFTLIAEISPEKLIPHLGDLVTYMILQQENNEDPELAVEAAEFWLSICECDVLRLAFAPYISRVIPVLLRSLVYDEDDAAILVGNHDDAEEQDKEQDIKPIFASTKASRQVSGVDAMIKKKQQEEGVDQDALSEGEIDEDDEDYLENPEEEWSVRKCSAAALDTFALHYHAPVFTAVLPYLKNNLQHPTWTYRESAVLALGAIADGCMDSVTPHLPDLVPYLVTLLDDPEPVVKKITCWCLGRYAGWAAGLDAAGKTRFFEPMLSGLLRRMLDNNKKVQIAAASGVINAESKAEKNIVPYCQQILVTFAQCLEQYQDRNMYVLYDCIQTLAVYAEDELSKSEYVQLLMPPLFKRWYRLSDDSKELTFLLECMGYLAASYGELIMPFAPIILERVVKIIYDNLQQAVAFSNNAAVDEPDKDFLIVSLDIISSLLQATHINQMNELIANTRPSPIELLRLCLEDTSQEVRLSAYALLGDAAIHCFPQILPFLPAIMPVLIKAIDIESMTLDTLDQALSVVNNACWAAGEIAVQYKEHMVVYVGPLYERLLFLVTNENVPEALAENAAVALGRLGYGCADQLAPELVSFASAYLQIIEDVMVTPEKGSSLHGFNQIVKRNPQAMENCMDYYFELIATFPMSLLNTPDYADLKQSFYEVCIYHKTPFPPSGVPSVLQSWMPRPSIHAMFSLCANSSSFLSFFFLRSRSSKDTKSCFPISRRSWRHCRLPPAKGF